MKSWWIRTADNAMSLELRDIPIPQPGPGQVCIRIRAASLNRGEFIAGHGLHTSSKARPAGFEAAGEVTSLGAGVTRWKLGDRVMGRCDGSFAEYGCMTADEVFAVPARLTWEQAAASTVVFLTVYEALMAHGRLASGEWVLVTGISSGVGVAALQVAKALGAKVIGTSGSAEKLAHLKAIGLDAGIQCADGENVVAAEHRVEAAVERGELAAHDPPEANAPVGQAVHIHIGGAVAIDIGPRPQDLERLQPIKVRLPQVVAQPEPVHRLRRDVEPQKGEHRERRVGLRACRVLAVPNRVEREHREPIGCQRSCQVPRNVTTAREPMPRDQERRWAHPLERQVQGVGHLVAQVRGCVRDAPVIVSKVRERERALAAHRVCLRRAGRRRRARRRRPRRARGRRPRPARCAYTC